MPDSHNSTLFHKALISTAFALGLGLFAGFAPASAAPLAGAGLASPGLTTELAAYKRNKHQQLYVVDSYRSASIPRSSEGMPFGGSDEVRELQRLFPSTLWPESMRYFRYR